MTLGEGLDITNISLHYRPRTAAQRMSQLFFDYSNKKIMLTSSFGTNSAMLLHLYARVAPLPVVYFIDTGYHFSATLQYKAQLSQRLNLQVVDVRPEEWKHAHTTQEQTWKTDPDFCCSINKVEPLAPLIAQNDIWISGLMRWQTPQRANLDIFEDDGEIIKFSPLLDVTEAERNAYIVEHDLPPHPMLAQGFASVGCEQCTQPGNGRMGRWATKIKTECGLHKKTLPPSLSAIQPGNA